MRRAVALNGWRDMNGAYRSRLGETSCPGRPSLGKVAERDIGQVTDAAEVIGVDRFQAMRWDEESALLAYQAAQLLLAIRAKVVYLGAIASDTFKRPDALAAFRASQTGERANAQLTAISRFARVLSLPNNLRNLQNLVSALEISVLPRFGLYARGVVPLVKLAGEPGVPKSDFYGSRVQVPIPPGRTDARVMDFGNLFETSVIGDIAAFERAGAALKLDPGLGILPAIAVSVLWIVGGIIVGGVTVVGVLWSLKEIFSERDILDAFASPEFMKFFQTLPPNVQATVLERINRTETFFDKATKLVGWIIGGVIIVTIAGIAFKLASDDMWRQSPRRGLR